MTTMTPTSTATAVPMRARKGGIARVAVLTTLAASASLHLVAGTCYIVGLAHLIRVDTRETR